MTTAVVEFDSLADAIGSGPENHYLLLIGRLCFVFLFVSRVKIRRIGFELGAAGVDPLVDRNQPERFAISADLVFGALGQISQPAIREGRLLERAQEVERNTFKLRHVLIGSS